VVLLRNRGVKMTVQSDSEHDSSVYRLSLAYLGGQAGAQEQMSPLLHAHFSARASALIAAVAVCYFHGAVVMSTVAILARHRWGHAPRPILEATSAQPDGCTSQHSDAHLCATRDQRL
jgi:hypothetical protein